MLETPKILAFAGSLRAGSYNKRLVKLAAQAARDEGLEVTLLDLSDLPMPIFNQDDEDRDGLPANAKKFKELLTSHHGFLLSSPEYNSSIPGVLKNAIDWASRAENEAEPPLVAFTGKTCALMSASPSWLGGTRSLVHVRAILGNIGVFVLPGQVNVASADQAFDDEGKLKERRPHNQLVKLVNQFAEITRKLN